jgi:hypothetical protein
MLPLQEWLLEVNAHMLRQQGAEMRVLGWSMDLKRSLNKGWTLYGSYSYGCNTKTGRFSSSSSSICGTLTPVLVPRSSPEALHARRRDRPLLAK